MSLPLFPGAGDPGPSFSELLKRVGSDVPVEGGGGGSEAIRHGVGAACASNADCTETGQACLSFKGGYCGVQDCVDDAHCPQGSACVKYTDGKQYCFLLCLEKPDCNFSRPPEIEANCSSSIEFVSGAKTSKVCLPPTG